MHIAIIGAGFSGLALAYHLLLTGKCQVTLFDPNGIGGGASGISTGLLHPYAGEQARRSWRAEEGLRATKSLLEVASMALKRPVASYSGILRYALSDEQKDNFTSHIDKYCDVKKEGNAFLIASGITVYSQRYLEGLWLCCKEKGAVLQKNQVDSLQELVSFDQVVIAGGAGSLGFKECKDLPVSLIKGQILSCLWPEALDPLERSIIGKGYVARGEDAAFCHVGATYERGFLDAEPCREKALGDLTAKISSFFPLFPQLKVVDCRAGVRVARRGHYLPLVGRMDEKTWAFTAFGSRGLLYHAYLAELLCKAIIENEPLPMELHCALFKNSSDS